MSDIILRERKRIHEYLVFHKTSFDFIFVNVVVQMCPANVRLKVCRANITLNKF